MTVDVGEIRTGLARRLEALDELVAVYPTAPDRVVTPSAAVLPSTGTFAAYHEGMGGGNPDVPGHARFDFDVIVFAGRFDVTASQDVLDRLIAGPTSVPAVLEADQTLNGAATVVTVRAATNYGVVTVADTTYLGVRFVVEVYAS